MTSDDAAGLIGDAADVASRETAQAIEEAAKINEDPAVAEVLDDAAVKADQTVARVGWLRSFLHRLAGREH